MNVSIRRATTSDVDFLVGLVTHEEVEPFLAAVGSKERSEILADVERSEREPDAFGMFVIEVTLRAQGRCGSSSRTAGAGSPSWEGSPCTRTSAEARWPTEPRACSSASSTSSASIAQMEIYGFNERAMAHAERAGFVREGVRRKAYWRNEQWVDGVLYGLVAEDLSDESPLVPFDAD